MTGAFLGSASWDQIYAANATVRTTSCTSLRLSGSTFPPVGSWNTLPLCLFFIQYWPLRRRCLECLCAFVILHWLGCCIQGANIVLCIFLRLLLSGGRWRAIELGINGRFRIQSGHKVYHNPEPLIQDHVSDRGSSMNGRKNW